MIGRNYGVTRRLRIDDLTTWTFAYTGDLTIYTKRLVVYSTQKSQTKALFHMTCPVICCKLSKLTNYLVIQCVAEVCTQSCRWHS